MKAVLQRVSKASVAIDGKIAGEIGAGIAALVAVTSGDGEAQIKKMAEKIVMLRIFEDEAGKMNKSLIDISGEVLCVSNFTVAGDCSSGRRPSFTGAERPEKAKELFGLLLTQLKSYGLNVQTGEFGADMQVSIVNDGPVTLILEV